MKWGTPPDYRVFNDLILQELRSRPGMWAAIKEYSSSWKVKHPRDIEIKWVTHGLPRSATLWARAVPQPTPEPGPWTNSSSSVA